MSKKLYTINCISKEINESNSEVLAYSQAFYNVIPLRFIKRKALRFICYLLDIPTPNEDLPNRI